MSNVAKKVNGLAIQTTAQIPKFTKGQAGLLSVIKQCVETNTPLLYDMVVRCYCDNVRSTYKVGHNYMRQENGRYEYARYETRNIWNAYQQGVDGYYYRNNIRAWLISTIGILVLKNQLVAIPVINLPDE